MASPFISAIFFLSLLCICQADDLISRICPKTTNPPLCFQTLRSDPRAGGADLRGLAKIIIEKSINAVQDVIANAKSIGGEKANTCVETSRVAIDELNQCVGYLNETSRATGSEIVAISWDAIRNVATCDHEFGSDEPPKLKTASQKVQDLINVLIFIANNLITEREIKSHVN
ncbi:hypothetical protein CASFOL_039559 [Castilleja foliolosa]|uniref:Pectinesterase inhibitor domain-containing protein n=1 Tax=Castilleja foliolosa TaxID=1961234 RepID=A0ABD3BFV7_9LAMI